jgi:hypothetical protein
MLVEFYEMCKGLNFARNFQFPVLEQVRFVFNVSSDLYCEYAINSELITFAYCCREL